MCLAYGRQNTTYKGEIKRGDHQVVEEEEHHSWPVVPNMSNTKKSKPREKTRIKAPGNWSELRVGSWCKRKKEPLKHDQSSRYMPRIRFMPGKFKFWWSDPFKNFKLFHNGFKFKLFYQHFKSVYNSTAKFLTIYEDREELNGLDRVQVKEKPPD